MWLVKTFSLNVVNFFIYLIQWRVCIHVILVKQMNVINFPVTMHMLDLCVHCNSMWLDINFVLNIEFGYPVLDLSISTWHITI